MNTDCKNKCENKNCENKTNSSYIKRIIKWEENFRSSQ